MTNQSKVAEERAAEIAAGLTEAQRVALLGDPNDDMPSDVAMSFMPMALGLFRPVSLEPPRMGWTDLGLAVRDHLRGEQ